MGFCICFSQLLVRTSQRTVILGSSLHALQNMNSDAMDLFVYSSDGFRIGPVICWPFFQTLLHLTSFQTLLYLGLKKKVNESSVGGFVSLSLHWESWLAGKCYRGCGVRKDTYGIPEANTPCYNINVPGKICPWFLIVACRLWELPTAFGDDLRPTPPKGFQA